MDDLMQIVTTYGDVFEVSKRLKKLIAERIENGGPKEVIDILDGMNEKISVALECFCKDDFHTASDNMLAAATELILVCVIFQRLEKQRYMN